MFVERQVDEMKDEMKVTQSFAHGLDADALAEWLWDLVCQRDEEIRRLENELRGIKAGYNLVRILID
jgi:hypothetical protein